MAQFIELTIGKNVKSESFQKIVVNVANIVSFSNCVMNVEHVIDEKGIKRGLNKRVKEVSGTEIVLQGGVCQSVIEDYEQVKRLIKAEGIITSLLSL